jgi:hypothetical protein
MQEVAPMMIIDGSLAPTLAALRAIADPGQRLRVFTGAIVEQGGSIVLPPDSGHWGPCLVEFSFHGILGTGQTPEEALADWMKCAERSIEAGIGQPRPQDAPRYRPGRLI